MAQPINKFSLVITNYNRADFLDRAIRSCTNQIVFRTPFEVIVVDDGSTDHSREILSEFESDDVRVIYSDTNRGVAHASNVGLEAATGDYIMRVDADDFLNQHACSFMGAILDENDDIDFVYCDHYRVDVRGIKISKVRLDNDEAIREHGAGIMFRTSQLHEIGGFDETLSNCEDYDLIVRMQKAGSRGHYLPVPLYRYYIHGENLTLQADRAVQRERVRRRHSM